MVVTLPQKKNALQKKAKTYIRNVAKVIGLIVSSFS